MSVYITILSIDGDENDPDNTTGAPYVYKGSHILPTADSERGGWMDVAGIPAFCGANGGLVDYLRVSMSATVTGDDPEVDVLLDRPQVEALRDTLTLWLTRDVEKE